MGYFLAGVLNSSLRCQGRSPARGWARLWLGMSWPRSSGVGPDFDRSAVASLGTVESPALFCTGPLWMLHAFPGQPLAAALASGIGHSSQILDGLADGYRTHANLILHRIWMRL